jgi:hypothetical protein
MIVKYRLRVNDMPLRLSNIAFNDWSEDIVLSPSEGVALSWSREADVNRRTIWFCVREYSFILRVDWNPRAGMHNIVLSEIQHQGYSHKELPDLGWSRNHVIRIIGENYEMQDANKYTNNITCNMQENKFTFKVTLELI